MHSYVEVIFAVFAEVLKTGTFTNRLKSCVFLSMLTCLRRHCANTVLRTHLSRIPFSYVLSRS